MPFVKQLDNPRRPAATCFSHIRWREATISIVPQPLREAVIALGLAGDRTPIAGAPLAGGVSSDIWRIDLPSGPVCAKRALEKLKVAADWHAPVIRNAYEAAYLCFANEVAPGAAPRVLARHGELGVLVMEYLPADRYPTWKARLMAGDADAGAAARIGGLLGLLHQRSAADRSLARRFADLDLFRSLRIEPYFAAAGAANPGAAQEIGRLGQIFEDNRIALVHGDFSPKNILVGTDRVVVLDAECAIFGDPAFDVAFCLTHLLLKATVTPGAAPALHRTFDAFLRSHGAHFNPPGLHARTARYLGGLMLARLDGKSPVEYLTDASVRMRVRSFAMDALHRAADTPLEIAARWYPGWAAMQEGGSFERQD